MADMALARTEDADAIRAEIRAMGRAAKAATAQLATTPPQAKTRALKAAAAAIRADQAGILAENAKDMAFGKAKGLTPALLDRLELNPARIEAMAQGLDDIADLPDPVGAVTAEWTRPNGLRIARVRTPLGVIGVIYESRPNVTADAGALCLKAGNAVILRGGSESIHSSTRIADCLRAGLREAGLPEDAVQIVRTRDRAAVGALLTEPEFIDVIVPRGGKSLIQRVMDEARVPVFAHLEGLCHVYLDKAADPKKAEEIVWNAKMRRTGVCGSAETLLVDKAIAATLLPGIARRLIEGGCEIRGDEAVRALVPEAVPATEQDWLTEYLDAIISIRVVDGLDAAIAHIERYGSHHTDSIVTEDQATADAFLQRVDSAIVMHNASTQFADGGEFGMGAEIGISTGRMHARGPVGAEQLTSFKYVVRGTGQTRP